MRKSVEVEVREDLMGARDSCSCGFVGRRQEVVSVRRAVLLPEDEADLRDKNFDRGRVICLEAIEEMYWEERRWKNKCWNGTSCQPYGFVLAIRAKILDPAIAILWPSVLPYVE